MFQDWFPQNDIVGANELEQTLNNFPNPEMINNQKETSPSGRLQRIIRGYEKVIHGTIMADAIGLSSIRQKSPRFNMWIEKIESLNS